MKIKLHAETKILNYSTLDKLNAIMKFKNMVNLEPKRYYLQIYNFFYYSLEQKNICEKIITLVQTNLAVMK